MVGPDGAHSRRLPGGRTRAWTLPGALQLAAWFEIEGRPREARALLLEVVSALEATEGATEQRETVRAALARLEAAVAAE